MEKYDSIIGRLKEQQKEVERILWLSGWHKGVDYIFEGIYLQGSQNYEADHEHSDVDSKYVLLPTVKSLLRGVNFTRDASVKNNEKVSIKPFMAYVDLFFKGNVNNLEMLFTPYSVYGDNVNLIASISRKYREDIVEVTEKTISSAIIGMMTQKHKSLFRGTETTQPLVDKLGYDPKDAQHIFRLEQLYVNLFDQGESFEKSLIMPEKTKQWVKEHVYSGVSDADTMDYYTSHAISRVKMLEKELNPQNDGISIKYIREEIAELYETEYVSYLKEEFF